MRTSLLAVSLIAAGAAAGCATVEPQVALPAADAAAVQAETERQQTEALDRRWRLETRLAGMAHRLAVANADQCPETTGLSGVVLQEPRQYDRRLREAAVARWSLGPGAAIHAVAEGGPADRAGLKPGDRIVAVDGEPVKTRGYRGDWIKARGVSDAEALRVEDRLRSAARDRADLRLTVARGEETLDLTVQTERGCAYPVHLVQMDEVNAFADGERVYMTTGMVRFVRSDDELAVVLGHEFAHNAMRHRARMAESTRAARAGGVLLGAAVGVLTGYYTTAFYDYAAQGTRESRLTLEREADYVGLYFAARAGFDVSEADELWRRMGADYAASTYARSAHPGSPERALVIGAARNEIAAKRERGVTLVPTPARVEALQARTPAAQPEPQAD